MGLWQETGGAQSVGKRFCVSLFTDGKWMGDFEQKHTYLIVIYEYYLPADRGQLNERQQIWMDKYR